MRKERAIRIEKTAEKTTNKFLKLKRDMKAKKKAQTLFVSFRNLS